MTGSDSKPPAPTRLGSAEGLTGVGMTIRRMPRRSSRSCSSTRAGRGSGCRAAASVSPSAARRASAPADRKPGPVT